MNILRKITALLFVVFAYSGATLALEVQTSEPPDAKQKQEQFDLSMVIDNRAMPELAAAIELRPFMSLLNKVKIGSSEKTLRPLGSFGFSHAKLLATPKKFRGQIVFAHGVIVQLERVNKYGVGRLDNSILYKGVLANLRMRRGVVKITYWGFYTLRRKNNAPLYAGDRVNLAGYYFKNMPLFDAKKTTHWMPLVVAPWPSYPIKRTSSKRFKDKSLPNWMPINYAAKQVGLDGLLPFSFIQAPEVWSRLVIDFKENSPIAADNVNCNKEVILSELKRYLSISKERVVIIRKDAKTTKEVIRELMLEAGVVRYEVQDYAKLTK